MLTFGKQFKQAAEPAEDGTLSRVAHDRCVTSSPLKPIAICLSLGVREVEVGRKKGNQPCWASQ